MLLACQNISKAFGTKEVLKDINFHVNEKEKIAIIGINGSGKTTLLKIIMGEESADSGQVVIAKDTTIGYLSQHQDISFDNTIYGEMLATKQYILDLEANIRRLEQDMKHAEGEELEKILETYNRLSSKYDRDNGYSYESEITGVLKGLGFGPEDYDRHINTLSGGQKMRIALGRLLLTRPDIIILDEPTSQLDPIAAADFLGTLRKMSEDLGLTVILTEHRLEEALPMADMLAVLDEGRLIAFGEPKKTVMQVKNSAVFESMPAAVQIFAAVDGEGDAPLTVSDARAFIASRTHASVKAAQPSAEPNPELAAELKNCWFRYEKNAPDILRGLSLTLNKLSLIHI